MLGAIAYSEMKNGRILTRASEPVNGAQVALGHPERTPGVRATMHGHPMIATLFGWAPFLFTHDELDREDWEVVE